MGVAGTEGQVFPNQPGALTYPTLEFALPRTRPAKAAAVWLNAASDFR